MTNFATQHGDKCETMVSLIDSNIASLLALRNKFVLLRAATTISEFIQESTEELTRLATAPDSDTAIDTQGRAQEMFIGHPATQRHIRARHDFHFAKETSELVGVLEEMLCEINQIRGGEAGSEVFVPGAGTSSDGLEGGEGILDKGKQRQQESRVGNRQRDVSGFSSRGALVDSMDDQEIKAIGMITIGDWIDASIAERGGVQDADAMDE